jgi:hypothetical protein
VIAQVSSAATAATATIVVRTVNRNRGRRIVGLDESKCPRAYTTPDAIVLGSPPQS